MKEKQVLNVTTIADTLCSRAGEQYDPYSELRQEKHFAKNVVTQILHSRRLLIDHVECLENTLFEVELRISKYDVFSLANLSLVGSLTVLLNVVESIAKPVRYAATLVGTSFASICFYKCLKKVQNTRNQSRVEALIQSIGSFGNGVKKNISYFNELLFMRGDKVTIEDIHYKRTWGCIQAIKTVTEMLFHATRYLEETYTLSPFSNDLYSPIEDLSTCHYFTRQLIEFRPQHIKDFYNIFAYIQSQFLLRLALSVAEHPTMKYLEQELPKLTDQIKSMLMEEEKNFLRISSTLRQRRVEERLKMRKMNADGQHYAPTVILKDISLKLTSSIVAVAEEFEKLDNSLQNIVDDGGGDNEELSTLNRRTKLLGLADTLRAVELSLSMCNDDFQRLMLIYNKYVLNRLASGNEKIESKVLTELATEDEHLKSLSLPDIEEEIPKGDDYFAYTYENIDIESDDEKESEKFVDCDIFDIEEKVTKKRFRPVLKQLKDKIDPIREHTLSTERQVLAAKGINVNQFYGLEDVSVKRMPRNSDSDQSHDSDEEAKKEQPVRGDHYGEVREFLANKAPMRLFQLPTHPVPTGEEEIIE